MTPRHSSSTAAGAGALTALVGLALWARRTRPAPPTPSPHAAETRSVHADDGTALHVEVGGAATAATTVVFVHGFLARSGEFDAQWEHLGSRARLVRFDHRGHGCSGRIRGACDVECLAHDLGQVVDEVAPVGPVVLVGHSMGGMTVLALAAERPEMFGEHVTGVALIASAAGHDIPGHPVENAFRWLARRRFLAVLLWLLRVVAPVQERLRPRGTRGMRMVVRWALFGRADASPDLVRQTQRMLEEPPMRTVAALQGAILRHDKRDSLGVLARVPVAIVVGSDDRLTRAEHSRVMAREIGDAADLVVLPGVGHTLMQTRPVEVNSALDRLLDRADRYALANPSGSQTSPAVVT
ncbi:MAG TPA: alpha/beta hydrolase [Mycobacteriales bacterium]|nr:alpha/beta hydrolase [Mycobacteriales bacterium]